MLTGRPPHFNLNKRQLLMDILEKPVEMKSNFSEEVKSLL
jgi:hypothetical protein